MESVKYLDDIQRHNLSDYYAIRIVLEKILESVGQLEDKADILLLLISMLDETNKQIDLLWREEEEYALREQTLRMVDNINDYLEEEDLDGEGIEEDTEE